MERFHGVLTAIVTPFMDGKIDEQGLVDLVEFQIKTGIHGIVPCGTTGESATLSFSEHKRVIELTVNIVAGRVPVIASAGANNTLEAIELTGSAEKCGADAVLSIVPYYNKPNQDGIFHHFKAIAESTPLPLFLYNVPGRTVVNLAPETVARLAEIDNIVGIKEACGSLEQISDVIRMCPPNFTVLSGDDFTAMPTMSIGGKGVISVVSNIHPEGMVELTEAALNGDVTKAQEMHYRLFQLMKCMFCNPSPGPVKKGLQLMGLIGDASTRLPITSIDDVTIEKLKGVMNDLRIPL